MRSIIITTVILASFFLTVAAAQEQRTFILKSGDKLSGTVLQETDTSYVVSTAIGSITILKANLQPNEVVVELNTGDTIRGILLERTDAGLHLSTAFGEIFVDQDKIEKIVFVDQQALAGTSTIGSADEKWFFSDEQLMDIWFDPTGSVLRRGEFYLSALSWAVGISDEFMISSRWANMLGGDFNFRPKFRLWKVLGIEKQSSLSVGFHLHSRGLPGKYKWSDQAWLEEIWNPATQTYDDSTWQGGWVRVGSTRDRWGDELGNADDLWFEFFGGYTVSNLNADGDGRTNVHVGVSAILYGDEDLMPRVYVGVDRDIRRNLKIMGELAWDPYYVPFWKQIEDVEIDIPLFADIGFLTNALTKNENFWLGIHYQQPFLTFYYKF